jgi:hypothetical protein
MFGTIGLKLLGLYFMLGVVQALGSIVLSFAPFGGIAGAPGVQWTSIVAWSVPGLITCAIGVMFFIRARPLAVWMFRDLPAPAAPTFSATSALTVAITAIGVYLIVEALPVLTTAVANWISDRAGLSTFFALSSLTWEQYLFGAGIMNGCVRLTIGILLVCFARRMAGTRLLRVE